MKLSVRFDDPEHGWVGLSVRAGDQTFADAVSYTPYDSFWELATALSLMADGAEAATVRWSGEPHSYQFRFARGADAGAISLAVVEFPHYSQRDAAGEVRLTVSGTFDGVCRPFWKAARGLQGRFTDEELSVRWHREFASEAFESLTRRVRKSGRT